MLVMRYLIQELTFGVAQRGVVAEAWLSIPTRRQGTNEMIHVRSGGKNMLLAFFNLWREARAGVARLQAEPGDWPLDTSDFYAGLFGTSAR